MVSPFGPVCILPCRLKLSYTGAVVELLQLPLLWLRWKGLATNPGLSESWALQVRGLLSNALTLTHPHTSQAEHNELPEKAETIP